MFKKHKENKKTSHKLKYGINYIQIHICVPIYIYISHKYLNEMAENGQNTSMKANSNGH